MKPIAVNHKFCVNNNLRKALVLNPNTFKVAISRSISVNDKRPKLYNTTTASRHAKNISMYTKSHIASVISSQLEVMSFIELAALTPS